MNTNINLTEFGGVIAGLLVVGAIFKHAFPNFPNRLIPLLTWFVGVLAYLALANGWADPKQWLAAILAAASATGVHSALKNTMQPSEIDQVAKPRTGKPGGTGPIACFVAALLCVSVIASPVVFTGCSGPASNAQAIAFYTLADTKALVDGAEKVYGRQVALGKVSAEQEAKADEQIILFHAAFASAVSAAQMNLDTQSPADLQRMADELVKLLTNLDK